MNLRVRRILSINSGSSSIKFACYRVDPHSERLEFKGALERIRTTGGRIWVQDDRHRTLLDQNHEFPDHRKALEALLSWLQRNVSDTELAAIGHRMVHGGPEHFVPERVTPVLLEDLRAATPFAPEHMPHALAAIHSIGERYPHLPQIACFDTAFHRRMPVVAQRLALPADLWDAGVKRYGFHGLSYEYVMRELMRQNGGIADQRIIIAHLGNGASMAAICRTRAVDTTMGFTPLGGLVMSTRCGDLDPGVVLYLLRERGLSPNEVDVLLNKRSGMLGISGTTSDMQVLVEKRSGDPAAALAVEVFCYQARKSVGALTAALGGLDQLVFTGGIGENAAEIRREVCRGLDFLGIEIDEARNREHAPVISSEQSRCTVRVMPTNEDLMIVRHCWDLLENGGER
jgi:acetate kinase